MSPLFRHALFRLSLYLFLGLLIGNEFDNLSLGLVLAFAVYVASVLINYSRFQQWLDAGASKRKPLLNAFWQGISDQVYRLVEGQRNEIQALQQELDFFKDSFQALDSALVVITTRGSIDWANRAAQSMLGIDAERDKGELLVNLFRAPTFIRFLDNKDFAEPLVVASPRNPAAMLEVQVMPFRSDYLLIFVRDISELIKLERVRQDFLANVSHELRTPLTVITGYLETLKDNTDQLPPTWSRVFEQMLQQSQRMDNMVTDLMWLSRLESVPETEQRDKVPLQGLLQGIISDASVASPDKQIELHMDQRCLPDGDGNVLCLQGSYEELRSAFSNLIQNAVKYTGEEGEIDVYCQWQGERLCVRVSDNGEGIDPVHIPRLTERFYRTDSSRTSSTGGTGLGLAIVKHVLGRHDATLDIASSVGKGSHFSCLFPADRVVR